MDSSENPFNSIPPVVILLVLAIMGIEAVLTMAGYGLIGGAAGIGWRITVAEDYAYSPAVWDLVFQRGDLSWDILMRFVTYTFVQGSFRQALYAGVLLLALGKFVGDVYGGRAVIVIYIASAITGAFVYGAIIPENVPLLGAYTPVYGMIGGYTYMMWLRLRPARRKPVAGLPADRLPADVSAGLRPDLRRRAQLDGRGCRLCRRSGGRSAGGAGRDPGDAGADAPALAAAGQGAPEFRQPERAHGVADDAVRDHARDDQQHQRQIAHAARREERGQQVGRGLQHRAHQRRGGDDPPDAAAESAHPGCRQPHAARTEPELQHHRPAASVVPIAAAMKPISGARPMAMPAFTASDASA